MSARDFKLKECSKIFHDTESATNEMLKAELNLEKNRTAHQRSLCHKLKRTQALFKLVLISFLQRNKTF